MKSFFLTLKSSSSLWGDKVTCSIYILINTPNPHNDIPLSKKTNKQTWAVLPILCVVLQIINAQKQDQNRVGQMLLTVPFVMTSLFLFMFYLFSQSFCTTSMYEADKKRITDKFRRQVWILDKKFCLWEGKTLLELKVLAHQGGLFLLLSCQ